MADLVLQIAMYSVLFAVLLLYIITLVNIEKSRFRKLSHKSRFITIVWMFPVFGSVYYWMYKKNYLKEPYE